MTGILSVLGKLCVGMLLVKVYVLSTLRNQLNDRFLRVAQRNPAVYRPQSAFLGQNLLTAYFL